MNNFPEEPSGKTGLLRLLLVQAQVVFNDNAAKLSLIALAGLVLAKDQAEITTNLLAGLLVLPFILFSPLCGWITDRYSKTMVLHGALLVQIMVMAGLIGALYFQSLTAATVGFFLLALQATLFSPAKQGILKELVGSERLNRAASAMEATTIIAILTGSFGGGWLLDHFGGTTGDSWRGAVIDLSILTALCLVSWLIFCGVPHQSARMKEPFRLSLFWEHFSELGRLWSHRELFGAALGSAWFYSLGGLFYLILVQVGRELNPALGAATITGILFGFIGLGIIAGSVLYSLLAKTKVTLRMMPLSALLMTGSLWALASSPEGGPWYRVALFFLGAAGGMFVVPCNAFLQDRSLPEERGRNLAATNLMTNIGGLATVGLQFVLAHSLQLNSRRQILFAASANALMSLVAVYIHGYSFLQMLIKMVTWPIYRVQLRGTENIPTQGGFLIVSNHVSYVDAFLLPTYCHRRVRFLAFERLFSVPVLGSVMRAFGAIPISPQHSKEAMRRTIELLSAGEAVCIFPEGELTRTGEIMGFKRGFELIARKANVPIVPVHLDSFWGSIFSFSGGKYFWKRPQALPRRLKISFGAPILPQEISAEGARQRVLELGEKSFRERPEVRRGLGAAALARLAATPREVLVVDCTGKPQSATCGEILVASLVLARRWKSTMLGQRIGIALPPGRGAIIANLAAVFAGKIPVNLNLTASTEAARASLRTAEIQEIITVEAIQTMFPSFPWTAKINNIGEEIKGLPRYQLGLAMLVTQLFPAWLVGALFGMAKAAQDQEAVLLFTSGSSGDPKGVPLTHQNLQANVAQVGAIELFDKSDRILGCLPLFHSFGCTFTLWLPLLRRVGLVTVPSPMDGRKIGEAVAAGKATILLGTPTFFRAYARKVPPEQFATLRLAVTGAEKLPAELSRLYLEKYQIEVMEGYGLTETSPVLSVNVPNPPLGPGADSVQKGNQPGSVGRLLPGIAYRLVDPESRENLTPGKTGLLQVKGANVFRGYLHEPTRSGEVLQEGWFNTGDLARVDEEGFFFIEGRLSRFAKIGGEMVPLVQVEEAILNCLGVEPASGSPVVVVSLPHPTKGESLVLLGALSINMAELRKKMASMGIPNLWIPKLVRQVEEIPMLGSGKIDLRACQELARCLGESKIENQE